MSRTIETVTDGDEAGGRDLDASYHEMAQDEAREIEALELAEATIGHLSD